jgi:competence ComEA-like helix-hairpin-helix protein
VKLSALLFPVLVCAQDLPEGDGRQLVEHACSVCHTLEPVTSQRATRQGWKSIVENMVQRGAEATGDEQQILIDYLAKNFPRASKVNVNKAGVKDIAATLEISAKEAESICNYRQEHGDFKDWESLAKVPQLDPKKLEGKKERVSFN